MNPGIVAQYVWPVAIGAATLVLFGVAVVVLRRLGVVPALPWSWTRATVPPDDASLRSMLLLLLAAAAAAAALPLFATAYVFRWFQSAKVVGLVVVALVPVAVPALIVWRSPASGEPAPAPAAAGPARPAAALALLLIGLAASGMIAVGYREPTPQLLALLLVAGVPLLATCVGAAGLVTTAGEERAARLAAMALWGACGTALVFATLAVAMTAQTLDVLLLARAQWNTMWYVVGQPVAALAFFAAAALAAHPAARAGVLGAGGAWRRAANSAALLALGALFTALFLAGGAGPWLPAWVWLVLKAAAVAAALALASRTVARATRSAATRYAWLAAGLAALNLVATAIALAVGGRAEP